MSEASWLWLYAGSVVLGWFLLLALLRSTLPPNRGRIDTVMEWTIAGCASLLGPVTIVAVLASMLWIRARGDRE